MHSIRRLSFAFALLGAFCATPVTSLQAQGLDIAKANVIDLTHALDADTIFWPTQIDSFKLTKVFKGLTEEGFFYAAYKFCLPEHGGTHLDAPFHFAERGWTVAKIPLKRLIAPAVVIDISAKAAKDPDYTLMVEDVTAWEAVHGKVRAGAIVLLRTGWSSRWPDKLAYLGDDTPGDASNFTSHPTGRKQPACLSNVAPQCSASIRRASTMAPRANFLCTKSQAQPT